MAAPIITVDQVINAAAAGSNPYTGTREILQRWVTEINRSPEASSFRELISSGRLDGKLRFDGLRAPGTGVTLENGVIIVSGSQAQTPFQITTALTQEGGHAVTFPLIIQWSRNPGTVAGTTPDARATAIAKLIFYDEAQSELRSTNYFIRTINEGSRSAAEIRSELVALYGPETGLWRVKLLDLGLQFSGSKGKEIPADKLGQFLENAKESLAFDSRYGERILGDANRLANTTIDTATLRFRALTAQMDGSEAQTFVDAEGNTVIVSIGIDGLTRSVIFDTTQNVVRVEEVYFDAATGQLRGRTTNSAGNVELSTSTFGVSDDGSKLEFITYLNGTTAIRAYEIESPVPNAFLIPVQIGGLSLYESLYFDGSIRAPLVENGQVSGYSVTRQDGVKQLSEQYSVSGTLLSKTSVTPLDDGSSITAVAYPNGTVETTTRNADNSIFQRSQTIQGLDGRSSDTTITSGIGQILSQTHVDYYPDDFGNQSRIETVTNFANGVATTIRNTYDTDRTLFNSETVRVFDFAGQQTTNTLNDIAGFVGAIQTGTPFTQLSSGIRLLNTVANPVNPLGQNARYPSLNAGATIVNGLSTLYNLGNAFESGDALIQLNATLSTINYVNASIPLLLNGGSAAAPFFSGLNSALNGTGGLISGGVPGAIPVVGLILSIRSGDPVGIVSGVVGIVNPALLSGPVGWVLAGISIIRALTTEPPEAWGIAKAVFDEQTGQFKIDVQGIAIGAQKAEGGLQGIVDHLNSQAAGLSQGNALQFGIIPQRLPSLTWRERRQDDKGYAVNAIDPITGEQSLPFLRFDDNDVPFSSRPDLYQPDPTDPRIRYGIANYMAELAVSREAIGAAWEVNTARIQATQYDPNAGLSERERAAKLGETALFDPVTGKPVGEFRPITLDMDGDGLISHIHKDAPGNTVGFRWDEAPSYVLSEQVAPVNQFYKQTEWVGANDAFLWLDRNYNGAIDGGAELFSNIMVSDDAKGVRSLDWVDANRDGKITNVDPVFAQLRIWQDTNQDGDNYVISAGQITGVDPNEVFSLSSLGITELDFKNGKFIRNGIEHSMRSDRLNADSVGSTGELTLQSGILIRYSNGIQELVANRVTSLVGGDERIEGQFEDGSPTGAPSTTPQEIAILASSLLANDGSDPSSLSIVSVSNASHGSVRLGQLQDGRAAVFFMPEANYHSGIAGDPYFDYVVQAQDGEQKTVRVEVPLASVNDVTQVEVQLQQRTVYGYGIRATGVQVPSDGNSDAYWAINNVERDKGVPFFDPYYTVMGKLLIVTVDALGEVTNSLGASQDTGIPQSYLNYHWNKLLTANSFDGTLPSFMDFSVDGKTFRIDFSLSYAPGPTPVPATVFHDTPLPGTLTWNDGQLALSDPDFALGTPVPATYAVVTQGVYGTAAINADGSFEYTGRRFVDQNINGEQVGRNIETDEAGVDEERFTDVFTVKITDSLGAETFQDVSVTHFGPRPNPTVATGAKKPIAIDLNGDGFSFINVDDSNVFFDVNGDGWARRTSWINPQDGLLAYDQNGNGKVDNGLELSFTRFKAGAQTDLEGFAAFDTNNDGRFTAADAQWSKFGVWQDSNSNGVTDTGEFRNLTDMGISEIGLGSDGRFRVINGQTVHGVGSLTKTDGTTLAIADVTFNYKDEVRRTDANGQTQVVPLANNTASQTFTGDAGRDLALGTEASDSYLLGDGDDSVVDDLGDDVIDAGAGNDIIFTGLGNDVVLAMAGSDKVFTGSGNDFVIGDDEFFAGDDLIMLGEGNDVAFGAGGNDFIGGGDGNDVISGDAGNDQLFGEGGQDALMGGAGDDELYGLDQDDLLYGDAGKDLLAGGDGNDTMEGGLGDDTYEVDSAGDIVTELVGEGNDTVRSSLDYVLMTTLENLSLFSAAVNGTGNEANNALVGNAQANVLSGLGGNDTLDGGLGADQLRGGSGDDIYYVDNVGDSVVELAGEGYDKVRSLASHTLLANVEDLTLIGTGFSNATGNSLHNTLIGNVGDNILDGQQGTDIMKGGLGNDTYVVDASGDQVIELSNAGNDLVRSAIDYTLNAHVESLELEGSATQGTGNELDNVINANDLGNQLSGLGGNDYLVGGAGQDSLLGGDGSDILSGNAGHDALDGGSGTDTLAGGAGNDDYVVDHVADVIAELLGEGTDSVESSVSHTLAANVENLTLTGTASVGTGNELANQLTANDLGNTLAGLAGADVLVGGTGADTLLGGADNDALTGNAGNDVLDGGTGADAMQAGAGDDQYVVDSAGDAVTELANEGIDAVASNVNYTLTSHVENLRLTGAALNGTGNELANTLEANDLGNTLFGLAGNDVLIGGTADDILMGGLDNDSLTGNAGADLLDGGFGADTMSGGLDNDSYLVEDIGDIVNEFFNEGTDLVTSSINYVLPEYVENLLITGAAVTASGNALDNTISGNALANLIDGKAGNDTMIGAAGDDRYIVESLGDVVTEVANEGNDTVYASVNYATSANVENLILTGAAITGTGNALANTLVGNANNNTLFAGAGADLLAGGTGNDSLDGGLEDDVYLWTQGDGRDSIVDVGGTDTIRFGAGITLDSIAAREYLVGTQRRIFVSVLNARGDEQPDQGIDFALNADGSSPIERFLMDNGQSYNLTQVKPPLVTTNGTAVADTLTGSRADDTMFGDKGVDILYGRSGHDTLWGGFGADKLFGEAGDDKLYGENDTDWLQAGSGNDLLVGDTGNDTLLGGDGDDLLDGGKDMDILDGGNGADTMLGGDASDELWGGAGDDIGRGGAASDLLAGGAGNDQLYGESTSDVLVGGGGADTVDGGDDNDFVDAGTGNDTVLGGLNNDFIAGGKGDDTITAGDGIDIMVFNKGDGQDTVITQNTQQDIVSLGGGIRYADLAMSKSGNDLVLKLGSGDQMLFKDWYSGTGGIRNNVNRLQMVTASNGGDFAGASADKLLNRKVVLFDFTKLVQAFDAARTANPSLAQWSVTTASLNTAYLSGSNTQALGGDLAFRYATLNDASSTESTYGDFDWNAVRTRTANFGNALQTLSTAAITPVNPWAALQAGTSLIVEQATGAAPSIQVQAPLTPEDLVTAAFAAQQQLNGQTKPGWA